MKYRLLIIASGYCAATIAAAILESVLVVWLGALSMGEKPDFTRLTVLESLTFVSVTFIATFLFFFIPASLFIACFEWRGWRQLFPHLIAGGLLAIPLALDFEPDFISTFWSCAIGITAGFIYWLIAGRTAGLRAPSLP